MLVWLTVLLCPSQWDSECRFIIISIRSCFSCSSPRSPCAFQCTLNPVVTIIYHKICFHVIIIIAVAAAVADKSDIIGVKVVSSEEGERQGVNANIIPIK